MSNLSFFINKILLDNEISYEWSNKLKKEVESLTEKKFSHYQDLTNLAFVTIDGADAKDFDDALYCEKSDEGFLLYVAIADVAGYVEQNSILDKEAFIRGTSIYFPKKVVPMLHEKISNDYCSLLPHKNRNVLSATKAFYECSKENIQTHGGMGATWEFDCHLFYRRARLLSANIGGQSLWKDKLVSSIERSNLPQ